MRIIAVVGFSDSGKTRLVARLIGEFKRRGLRAAAVKHCPHGFSLDRKGKDTWTYARAGADGVAMVSADEAVVLRTSPAATLRETARTSFPGADVVLVEGGKKEPGFLKIEVLRQGAGQEPVTPPAELLAVVTDAPSPPETSAPVFSADQTAELGDLILTQKEEAVTDIKLEVDGRNIPLNPFVRSFIEKTVFGMVSSLSGVGQNPNRLLLTIDRQSPSPAKPRTVKI